MFWNWSEWRRSTALSNGRLQRIQSSPLHSRVRAFERQLHSEAHCEISKKEKSRLSPKTGCSCQLTELGSMNALSNGMACRNEAPGASRLWRGGGESRLEIVSPKCEAAARCRRVSRGVRVAASSSVVSLQLTPHIRSVWGIAKGSSSSPLLPAPWGSRGRRAAAETTLCTGSAVGHGGGWSPRGGRRGSSRTGCRDTQTPGRQRL